MTFGKHIQNGLTNLGYSLERIADRQLEASQKRYEHDLESDRLGLIPDEEKLRLLKQDLYRVARGRGDVTGLCRAIATIENSIKAKYHRDNDFIGKFNQVFSTAILLSLLVTGVSYTALGICGDSQKPICQNTTVIARHINKQFVDSR